MSLESLATGVSMPAAAGVSMPLATGVSTPFATGVNWQLEFLCPNKAKNN